MKLDNLIMWLQSNVLLVVLITTIGLIVAVKLFKFYLKRGVQQSEEEKKAQAEMRAKQNSEQESTVKAEMQAKQKAEQEKKAQAEMQAKQKAEQEKKLQAEMQAKQKAEQEKKLLAEMQAKQKAEQEKKLLAEMQAKQKAEQEKKAQLDSPLKEHEVKPKEEEQSTIKFIGYKPINIFVQSEPFNYPYVIMPPQNCIIKFPRKGKVGRKGYKEDDFKQYLLQHFSTVFKIYDDRFITVKNSSSPFEPDIAFIDEKDGKNIFIDIEIDEPYEGINDISKRKATHYQNVDEVRNNAFKNRGWIVIRFAEIQVHKNPLECCMFLANVIRSINPSFEIPKMLNNSTMIKPVKQWTKEEAEDWSLQKYREEYLGINQFGYVNEIQRVVIEESDLGNLIEEQVIDEKTITLPISKTHTISKLDTINAVISQNKYMAFTYNNQEKKIAKPIKLNGNLLIAFCYIKNEDVQFDINLIQKIEIKQKPFTLEAKGHEIGIDIISNAVNIAIQNGKYIRIQYTRGAWTEAIVDGNTGEYLVNHTDSEQSIRTISNVNFAVNVLSEEQLRAYNLRNENYVYIKAYCHRRSDERTFRFDRISEIAILDI